MYIRILLLGRAEVNLSRIFWTANGKVYEPQLQHETGELSVGAMSLVEVDPQLIMRQEKLFAAVQSVTDAVAAISEAIRSEPELVSMSRFADKVRKAKSDAASLLCANEQLAMRLKFEEDGHELVSYCGIPMETWQHRWAGIVDGPHIWIQETAPGIAHALAPVLTQKLIGASHVRYSRNPESLDMPEKAPVFDKNGSDGRPMCPGNDPSSHGEWRQP